jgi:hypothetical protein
MLTFLWLGAPKNDRTTDSRITAIWGYIDILDRKVVKTRFKEFSVGLGCLQPVELLSEVKNFQGCIASTAKEDSGGDDERSDDFEHQLTLVTRRNVAPLCRRCELRKVADCKPLWTLVFEQQAVRNATGESSGFPPRPTVPAS